MKIVNKNEIIEKLKENELCILPTDTVYGLMAIISKENEEKLNTLKMRDKNQKISIIFGSVDNLLENVENLNEEKINMIKEKLPGKYTFIVNLKESFVKKYGFDRTDFGVRVTSNEDLQDIILKTDVVLATSCNYSKEDICVSLNDIKRDFDDKNVYVYFTNDGTNQASSIIDITKEKINILR